MQAPCRFRPGWTRVHAEERVYRAQDNRTFLDLLNRLWTQALKQSRGVRIKKVSVTLSELVAASDLQADLFANLPDVDLAARGKSEKLSRAMDKINHRFGRDTVLIGMTPSQGQSFSGSKIAFTRIPDVRSSWNKLAPAPIPVSLLKSIPAGLVRHRRRSASCHSGADNPSTRRSGPPLEAFGLPAPPAPFAWAFF